MNRIRKIVVDASTQWALDELVTKKRQQGWKSVGEVSIAYRHDTNVMGGWAPWNYYAQTMRRGKP